MEPSARDVPLRLDTIQYSCPILLCRWTGGELNPGQQIRSRLLCQAKLPARNQILYSSSVENLRERPREEHCAFTMLLASGMATVRHAAHVAFH